MIKNYFKTAFRSLQRNKIYSFINISGLSLGLACAMLIMLYVKDEVSYDRFHKNISNTYLIGRKITNADGALVVSDGYTGYLQGPVFAADIPGIRGFVRMQYGQKEFQSGGQILAQQVYFVDSNFFSAFTFPLVSGNPITALLGSHSVVISEDMAKKQFGSTEALGKTILMKEDNQFIPYQVSAVARNCPQNSSIKFQMLLPLKVVATDAQNKDAWANSLLNTFVVADPTANIKDLDAKMKKISEARNNEANKIQAEIGGPKWTSIFLLQPFSKLHLSQDYRAYELSDSSNPVFSYILSGIAIFILLIACINFVNLTIARSVKRAKEIGVRKVIGGGRTQLIAQFLGESFLLCAIAFTSAIAMVQMALPLFNQLAGKALALSYLYDLKLVAGYIALFIITALLAGFYPALVLSNYNPVQTLYNRFSLAGKNYLQKSLVIVQFALASFLIIATLTIISQFNYLTSKKLGYDDSNLLVINNWGIQPEDAKLFGEQMMKNPGIAGVSAKDMGWDNGHATLSDGEKIDIVRETVDENYIPLLKVPVIKGRNFSKEFPSDTTNAVLVNETFVKKAGWKDAIGKQINLKYPEEERFTIVGVVKDFHYQPLHEAIKAQVFSLKPGRVLGNLLVKINPDNKAASLRQIETVFKKIFPLTAYSYYFKDQENRQNYAAEAQWKQIMLAAAILTIFISCIGLFGLSVLSAEKRTKEIGIRKVLGASVGSVAAMLSIDFLKLVLVSLAVATPLSWLAADKWLQSYPYRITLSGWMFAGAALLVITIASAMVSFQAIRAGRMNPVKAIRTE